MKKLPTPPYDDFEAIRAASVNKQMSSYPHLRN
jgi:hypothetical protein